MKYIPKILKLKLAIRIFGENMSKYSDILDNSAMSIDPMDDNYQDKLKEVAGYFRGFNEALTFFIVSHGYDGNINDVEAKTQFIKEKYKNANISVPRNINK